MRRIVVTGMGAVTPLAADVEQSWSRVLAGQSGIGRLPVVALCDPSFLVNLAAGHVSIRHGFRSRVRQKPAQTAGAAGLTQVQQDPA